jgi:hypothetical protein
VTAKQEKLKPYVIECLERLRKLIDLDAPAVIIGASAWSLFTTILSAYGASAASAMVQHIRDENLHARGVCSHEDCTKYVERPNIGICEGCCKSLGLDDDLLAVQP